VFFVILSLAVVIICIFFFHTIHWSVYNTMCPLKQPTNQPNQTKPNQTNHARNHCNFCPLLYAHSIVLKMQNLYLGRIMLDVCPNTTTHTVCVISSEQSEWHCPSCDWCIFSRSMSVHYSETWLCNTSPVIIFKNISTECLLQIWATKL